MWLECVAWTAVFAGLFAAVRAVCVGPIQRQAYVYDVLFHGVTVLIGASLLYDTPHIMTDVWARSVATADWRLAQLPALQCGYYACALAMAVATTRRWDMIAHHVVAVVLSLAGAWMGTLHVAVLVTLAHNASDVLLLAGKLLHTDGYPAWASDACMYAFVVSWLYLRVYCVNAYVWWPAIVHNALRLEPAAYYMALPIPVALVALQGFWTVRIAQLVLRKVRSGDTQTDDDGGDE